MQLVAYGAQDVYLTGNPQITFVIKGSKVGYQRKVHIISDKDIKRFVQMILYIILPFLLVSISDRNNIVKLLESSSSFKQQSQIANVLMVK